MYADQVVEAIGTRHVALVGQSLGGFTAPLVWEQVRVRMLVFINAMIPVPGETPGQWWDGTGSTTARTAAARRGRYSTNFDVGTYFLHDIPPKIIQQGETHQRSQADIVFSEPCRFEAWPEVPIHVIAGRADSFRSTSSGASPANDCT
jgi:pimeloyl-ACP methyl ester carboxylesterase